MPRSPLVLLAVLAVAACAPTEPPIRTSTPPSSAVSGCPERYAATDVLEPWVPAAPTTETAGRLVPDADPVEALLCRYGGVAGGQPALDGEFVLSGGLERIRTDLLVPERLPEQRRACTLVMGPTVPYLLRLRYADGELWVSAVQDVNGCADAGNGAFVTSASLGERVARAFDAGTWAPPGADPVACRGGTGRAGQERELVPPGWRTVVVCLASDGARELDPATAAQVADVLAGLAAAPGSDGCTGSPDTASSQELAFLYDAGPVVRVSWTPGCEPSVRNGSLSARPSAAQTARLRALLLR